MNDSDLDYAQKTKKRSFVWNFFDKINQQRVQCRLCKHEQNYQGTTGNILRHLKAHHQLDATIKGQRDPENKELIKKLLLMTSSDPAPVIIDQKPITVGKVSVASDSSDTDDPYNDNRNKQMRFQNGNALCDELQEDFIYKDYVKDHPNSTKKTKLEEDRILAETEYYREKTAYFRFQKHLTALQAKKVKLEIDQIVLSNKNGT